MKFKKVCRSLAVALCICMCVSVAAYAADMELGTPVVIDPTTQITHSANPENDPIVTEYCSDQGQCSTYSGAYTIHSETPENDPVCTDLGYVDEDEEANSPRYSSSTTFTRGVGGSWSKSFSTNNIFSEDHNAYKVVVSGVSGRYKVRPQKILCKRQSMTV